MFKIRSGGFVFVEFAIALPLLILLMYGLTIVGLKIFDVGKDQLADYVLEEEVHDVLSRMIYDARAARSVKIENNVSRVTFTYGTIKEVIVSGGGRENGDVIANREEPRVYKLIGTLKQEGSKIDYKRQVEGDKNPITGDNYFGETRIMQFKFKKLAENVLHVTLEMQSEVTGHKIKISTAVYMPGCKEFKII